MSLYDNIAVDSRVCCEKCGRTFPPEQVELHHYRGEDYAWHRTCKKKVMLEGI